MNRKNRVHQDVRRKRMIQNYIIIGLMAAMCLLAGCNKASKQNGDTKATEKGTQIEKEIQTEENQIDEIQMKESQTEEKQVLSGNSLEIPVVEEVNVSMTAVNETVYTTTGVNVRTAPSTASEVVTVLSKGSSVNRIGVGDGWSKVSINGNEYYMSSQYLSAKKPEVSETTSKTNTAAKTGEGIGTKTSGGEKGILVAIDAGHQGKGNSVKEPDGPGSSVMKAKVSSGTAGVATGLAEYKLNLTVSLKLKEELVKRGYDVYMVREIHEVDLSNSERAIMANESGADIFVRIHANSIADSKVRGALTMCMTKSNPYNSNLYSSSKKLSQKVVDGICTQTGFKNRGIMETDTMSGINWCKIPVTIVEMGFMSNAEEDRLLSTEEYQNKIVQGIADGIDAYYSAE